MLDGVDPATGSARDFGHGGQHRAPKTSSSFTSNEAFAQAESAARNSPDFAAQAATGAKRINLKVPLSDALGPGYRGHVSGVTKTNPGATLGTADFTGGDVVARYARVETPSGGYDYTLITMYAEPR